ncbi:DUF4123 domain-containing protein [Pseudomonas sp. NUPR-001]|uniref:DUF4123 domain-containing protein n=1 Tax=Pseudomonas sp. NUPR-001 TaxID=3416058 RepID=UPI003F99D0F3
MTLTIPDKGLLLLDGAQYDDAVHWLSQHYGSDNPWPLFNGTFYEAIAGSGPFLLDASRGSASHRAWWGGDDLQHGVWLASGQSARQLRAILQRRLRVFDEQQGEYWLRLADGAVLDRARLAGAHWPAGFWYGVDSVWLRHDGVSVCAWNNDAPERDAAPADKGLTAQITLPDALMHALSLPANTEQFS